MSPWGIVDLDDAAAGERYRRPCPSDRRSSALPDQLSGTGDGWRGGSALSPRGIGRRDLRPVERGCGATICSVVRSLTDADHSWKVPTLERGWGATTVARLAGLLDTAQLPGFGAADGHERVGVLTYVERADDIEVVTVQALELGRGVRRTLMDLPTAVQMIPAVGVSVLTHGRVCDSVRRNTRTEETMLR
jgi:hypothetical protein